MGDKEEETLGRGGPVRASTTAASWSSPTALWVSVSPISSERRGGKPNNVSTREQGREHFATHQVSVRVVTSLLASTSSWHKGITREERGERKKEESTSKKKGGRHKNNRKRPVMQSSIQLNRYMGKK